MSDLIPRGTYLATVRGTALGNTQKGEPQLAVLLDVHLPDQSCVQRTWYGYFTEKSEPITLRALAALGFDATERSILELSPDDSSASPLVGVECRVVIEHETPRDENGYDLETRDRVRWINPRDGGGIAMKERMDPQAAAAFADRFRARVRASGGAPRPTTPAPKSAAAGPAAAPPPRPAGPAPNGTSAPRPAPKPAPAAAPPAAPVDFDDIPF